MAIAIPLRESTPSGGPEHFYDHRTECGYADGSPKPAALSFFREQTAAAADDPSTAAPVSHKVCETEDIIRLDEVDFGRQVACDLKADFLLANFGF